MLLPSSELDSLAASLAGGGGGYRRADVGTQVDPLTLVRAATPLFGAANFFSAPDGAASAGLGIAWSASTSGRARFIELQTALGSAPDVVGSLPLFCGFSFAADGPHSDEWKGFGAADLVLPQIAVTARGGAATLTVIVAPGSDPGTLLDALSSLEEPTKPVAPDPGSHTVVSEPSTGDWRGEVAEAIAEIKQGTIEKVVLGRSVLLQAESGPDPFDLVALLGAAYPQCYAFGWQVGDAAFVGASPELLLERAGPSVALNPLAGSAPRGEGEDEDRRLAEELIASAKDQEEHAIVVRDIAERLEPFTESLTIPEHPSLRRVASVQHLSTHVAATLRSDVGVLELLDVLHPTPAVGGAPRTEAMQFISRAEGLDRGWYTGGIGWVTARGDGRLALALRCGLLRNEVARLYAGAGIVADSDPEAELTETRLKLRPLVELLAAT